jgi:putative ABC transport system permease protein
VRIATTLLPALQSLRVHRLRSGLALLSVCLGVAAVSLTIIWGSVGQSALEREINSIGADLLIVRPGAAKTDGVWRATGSSHTLTEADGEAIAREIDDIPVAAPLMQGTAQLVYKNRNSATTVRGATPAWFAARPWPLITGRPLADEDVRRSAKVALLGQRTAKALFNHEDPSGQIIRIGSVPFTVIGVLEAFGHTLGGEDLDDEVLIPLTTARHLILGFYDGHPTGVGGLTLRVGAGADMSRATAAVSALLRQRHRLAANLPDDFVISDLVATQRAQLRSKQLTTMMLAGAAAVSLLVAGIGIMSLMLVAVHERRQEIGLRMAIGASRREIRYQFLCEAVALALIGSGCGVILACAAALVFGVGGAVPNPETLVAMTCSASAAVAISAISALCPACRAARLDPAEALAN